MDRENRMKNTVEIKIRQFATDFDIIFQKNSKIMKKFKITMET